MQQPSWIFRWKDASLQLGAVSVTAGQFSEGTYVVRAVNVTGDQVGERTCQEEAVSVRSLW